MDPVAAAGHTYRGNRTIRMAPHTRFLAVLGLFALCAGVLLGRIETLSAWLWLLLLLSASGFLIVASLFAFRPASQSLRRLVLGGLLVVGAGLLALLESGLRDERIARASVWLAYLLLVSGTIPLVLAVRALRSRRSAWAVAIVAVLALALDGYCRIEGHGESYIGIVVMQLLLPLTALGLYRASLFQIDRLAWSVWVFLGVSALTLCMDLFVVYLVGLQSQAVMAVSAAVLAWLYFPIRQSLWRRWSGRLRYGDYRQILPALIGEMLALGRPAGRAQAWLALLDRLLAPLQTQKLKASPSAVELTDGGACLRVPAVVGAPPLLLRYADRGDRLFSEDDRRVLSALVQIADAIAGLSDAARRGAAEERQRIGADLHDHVVPSLLSYVYRATQEPRAEDGREAIRELRNVIQSLGARTAHTSAPQ